MYPIYITRQFKSIQNDETRNWVKRIEYLRLHLYFYALSIFSDASSAFVIKMRRLVSKVVRPVIQCLPVAVVEQVDIGKRFVAVLSDFLWRPTDEFLSKLESPGLHYWSRRLCADLSSSSDSVFKGVSYIPSTTLKRRSADLCLFIFSYNEAVWDAFRWRFAEYFFSPRVSSAQWLLAILVKWRYNISWPLWRYSSIVILVLHCRICFTPTSSGKRRTKEFDMKIALTILQPLYTCRKALW